MWPVSTRADQSNGVSRGTVVSAMLSSQYRLKNKKKWKEEGRESLWSVKWRVELMENRWFFRAPKRHLRERRGGRWRGMRLRMGGGLQRPLLPSPTAPSRPSRATLSSCRWRGVQPQPSKCHFSFLSYPCSNSLPSEPWLSLMSPHLLPSSCFFFFSSIIRSFHEINGVDSKGLERSRETWIIKIVNNIFHLWNFPQTR